MESEKKEVKRDRSAAYPAISLEKALEFVKKLDEAFGKKPFSKESAVQKMEYKSINGAFLATLAALSYYGLLEREKSTYSVSALTLHILYPTEEKEAEMAIKKAAVTPKLFRSLAQEYSGRAIPTAINNILVQHYKISSKVADGVSQTFKKTMEYAKLYANGVIEKIGDEDNLDGARTQEILDTKENVSANSEEVKNVLMLSSEQEMKSFPMPSGLTIFYPAELAYAFAMGIFSSQLAALDEVVSKAKKENGGN